ncbi:peptidylprolyl isomerase [Parvularcula marina]|uniref:peptidylprolyl isomerase n=1 Tax=Parvularcula marina TaxID=2292771 RepID=A0A371RGI5_9PROT|nr:peptidylprolyl isomerase [Parvularcula marina]RFB04577.1 peptidylprolyl isomerase [Parvularcula marina]
MLSILALLSLFAADEAEKLGPTVGEIMEAAPEEIWLDPDPDQLIYIETEKGTAVVRLSSNLAQGHVEQVKTLAREHYYDGLHFYRVVHGFVAQGGDASGEKDKGSAKDSLTAEFEETAPEGFTFTPLGFADGYAAEAGYTDGMPAGRDAETETVWLAHCTGAFAFGRDVGRDTASTEFYITIQPQRYLDRNLTVFGRVIYGMDAIQALPRGNFGDGGVNADEATWTEIKSIRLESEIPSEDRIDLEYMDTSSETFRQLITARSARASEFFYYRPGYIDLCQMPLPVRLTPENAE